MHPCDICWSWSWSWSILRPEAFLSSAPGEASAHMRASPGPHWNHPPPTTKDGELSHHCSGMPLLSFMACGNLALGTCHAALFSIWCIAIAQPLWIFQRVPTKLLTPIVDRMLISEDKYVMNEYPKFSINQERYCRGEPRLARISCAVCV